MNLNIHFHMLRLEILQGPHSRWRAQITPGGRGSGVKVTDTRTTAERHRAMTWAQRLKRVFKLDLTSCQNCGGQVRVIACLEDPAVIGRILAPLDRPADAENSGRSGALYGQYSGVKIKLYPFLLFGLCCFQILDSGVKRHSPAALYSPTVT